MLLISLNLKGSKTKRFLLVLILILTVLAAIFLAFFVLNKPDTECCDYSYLQAREFFLNMNKLDVIEISSSEIQIPSEFSKTYAEYCQMQSQAGFDIEKYKGKKAKLYTYEVKNYENSENVRASLIVVNKKIIAADIYLYEQNGFVEALKARC